MTHAVSLASKWDRRFVEMAQLVATWSKDPDARVGAVIVATTRRQFSVGYNGFVTGAVDDYSYMDTPIKLRHTVHAELNAILNARADVGGWTLYSTKFPCMECAKAIFQAGVTRVVAPEPGNGASKWEEEQRDAMELLTYSGRCVQTYPRLEGGS